jgi:Cupin-like domain
MVEIKSKVRVIEGATPEQIPFAQLFEANEPVILKGLVANWGLVKAGQDSPETAMQQLEAHYSGKPVGVFIGAPEIKARFFYNDDCTGLNFDSKRTSLNAIFEQIRAIKNPIEHPYFYINSLNIDDAFPGLRGCNDLMFNHPHFVDHKPSARIWLGTESIASAHYDLPNNMACCVLGRRRFTLFPPEQIHNLYPGPLEPTPGGQVVTMVDLNNPDFDRFPRVRQALDAAQVAELEAGDALYYPSLWWHQVDAFDSFNILVNYWWLSSPAYMGNPLDIVLHGILGLRDRPEAEKKAWREMLDYYVFGSPEQARAHLPESAHGFLADLDDNRARRLRALLKQNLNR